MNKNKGIMSRRTELKLTQRDVAIAVGVTDQTVSNWETGMHKPKLTPRQTLNLCQVLQIDLEQLVKILDNKSEFGCKNNP